MKTDVSDVVEMDERERQKARKEVGLDEDDSE